MSSRLKYSAFHQVMFPPTKKDTPDALSLRKMYRYQLDACDKLYDVPWVIFDLETTGFHPHNDRIIEVGAVKIHKSQEVDRFSQLVSIDIPIPMPVQKLTGIVPDMLQGQPNICHVIEKFIEFLQGSLLICHNSAFDMTMLGAELERQNIFMDYSCLCTLKMARHLLHEVPNKKLVTLAQHYEIPYDTQHRSLDDARVTAQVFSKMLEIDPKCQQWSDFTTYAHYPSKK